METIIGLDIGTSGAKGVLVTATGEVVSCRGEGYSLKSPLPGWLEQDPLEWWTAAVRVLKDLVESARVGGFLIRGLSLTGQMNGAVLLDRQMFPVCPCLIWADGRTAVQCDEINARIDPWRLIEITGKAAVTGYTAPKLLWVREHWPEAFSRARKLLLPKDFVRLNLTGIPATDASDASNTLLFDCQKGAWSEEILDALGICSSLLPPVTISTAEAGKISPGAASLTGLTAGLPVFTGAGDSIAETVANGVVGEGTALSVLGTSGNISAFSRRPVVDRSGRIHTGYHVDFDCWILTGVQQASGLSLQWLLDQLQLFGAGDKDKLHETLIGESEGVPPGCEGLVYLPYLNGERTPHLDPRARGVFFGIGFHHTRAHFGRAVLEGVAMSQRDALDLFEEMELPASRLVISGRASRSGLWAAILSSVADLEVFAPSNPHGAALGSALLAAVGVGIYLGVEEACRACVSWDSKARPEPGAVKQYQKTLSIYRDIYRQLKPVFASTAGT